MGEVNFAGASIRGTLDCHNGQFINPDNTAINANTAKISSSVFLGKDKENASDFQAEGKLSFENATIGSELKLISTEINNPEKLSLNLRFANVKTFILESDKNTSQTNWAKQIKPDNLFLNGFVYNAFIYGSLEERPDSKALKDWLRLQPKERFALQPYEQLASVLKEKGYQEEATEILIAKEEDQRERGGLQGFGWLWNRFLGFTIRHGYRPERAFIFSVVIVVVGGVVFWIGYDHNLIYPTEKDCIKQDKGLINEKETIKCSKYYNYPKFNPWIYSLDVFLPIIDLRLKNAWIPNANTPCGEALRYYFWVQTASGWVLTTLWVAGFTGLVRGGK